MNDGLEQLWKFVGVGLGAIGLVFFILGALVSFGFLVFLALLFLIIAGATLFNIVSSKSSAIEHGQSTALWGLARIVSWNPTEGVLFFRNKMISFVDDDPTDGGGIRAMIPLLGEELACRVPLEIQTLNFQDDEVLTKEFLPLKVKGTIYWKINDLNSFYINVSKEVHTIDNRGHHSVKSYKNDQMNTADTWLRSMAEEKTRAVIGRMGTGLLMADRLSADVPDIMPQSGLNQVNRAESSDDYRTATDGLAVALANSVGDGVSQYGISVERIALQEVNLPPQIYAAAVEACQASYGPIKARAEALAKQMSLRAETEILGADVVGLREIAENIPAVAFQDILGPTFVKLAASLGKSASLPR